MDKIWIILITILSTATFTAGAIFLGTFLSEKKKDRLDLSLIRERGKKLQEIRRKNLGSAYFELKNNIFILYNIRELAKNRNFDLAAKLLEEIKVEHASNLSKKIRLNRAEFEVVDEMYLPELFKKKIEFNIGLCQENNTSYLEFRADIEKFIEKLKETGKKFKDVFIEMK
jgi:hypothetical protein